MDRKPAAAVAAAPKLPPTSAIANADGNNYVDDNNHVDVDDEDDEEALLLATATLGASIEAMDDYESNVLRDAELSSTPRLMMPLQASASASIIANNDNNNNNNNTLDLGFPSLHSLTPSRNVHADLPYVQTVLRQLRQQQQQQQQQHNNNQNNNDKNHKNYLKEQLLLSLLHTVTGDTDLAVRPQQEARQEQERKKRYRNYNSSSNNNTQDPSTDNINPIRSKSDTTAATKKSNPTSSTLKHSFKYATTGSTAADEDDIDNDPGRRLEQIKQSGSSGGGEKTVRFATNVVVGVSAAAQILSPSAVLLRSKKKRQRRSMQERRGLTGDAGTGDIDNDDDDRGDGSGPSKGRHKSKNIQQHDSDAVLTPEELEALQERKERLKKLREERERRRRKQQQQPKRSPMKKRRRRRLHGTPSRRRNDDTSEEEEEFEFTGEDENNRNSTTATALPKNKTLNTTTISTTTATSDHHSKNDTVETDDCVMCPLCQQAVSVPSSTNPTDVDAVLAQHMNACQNGRPSRGGSRQRRNEVPTPTASATVTTSKRRHDRKLDVTDSEDSDDDADDRDDFAADIEEEEEEVELADDVDESLELDGDTDENQSMERTRKRSLTSTLSSHSREAVDDWDEDDYEDRVAEWIEHGLEDMKNMKERDEDETPPGEQVYEGGLVIPAWVNDRLFPYQRTGLQWMWELHRQQNGGILGDEMGLGKTIQVVSFLGAMAASRKLKSILIISPATMLQHWLQELAKWAPGIRRFLIHQSGDSQSGPLMAQGRSTITSQKLAAVDNWLKKARQNRLFEIIEEEDLETRDPASFCGTGYAFVTTFENVRRNEEIWTRHKWHYVVMDEAQKIRNPSADVTLVCKRLKTPHRLALSGTPIQNDLRELWSIFDFVFPGRLGTLPVFEVEFADPIKRGGYANATPMQVQLAYRCAVILKDLINPYLLRRLKKDIKEVKRMPGKKEHVLFCRLSDQQREMYEACLRSDYVRNVFRGSAQLLGAITMLQKICNHPDLACPPDKTTVNRFLQNGYFKDNDLSRDLDADDYPSDDDLTTGILDLDEDDAGLDSFVKRSGKLDVLAKILPLWKKQGHRVLIFCQWIKMLDLIQRFVEHQGWRYGRLDGKTNIASRQRLVNRFNEDDTYFIMLCTTKTGGVGLNLTGANRIILYDPNWNPSVDAQARERSWRFGQEREVTVYRLVVAGSVEEKIYQRQIFKQAISNSVLTEQRQRRLFSQKDLKDLFTLKADSGSITEGNGGMTETTQMTRGLGNVNPENIDETGNQKDDGEIMKSVLQSQGLAGVFDHDIVEDNGTTKKASVREMEDRAKSIAREALRTLSQSVIRGQDAFNPETRFGGGFSSGSNGILSSIAIRSDGMKEKATKAGEMQQYTKLLKELRDYVRLNVPTTDEILEEFSSQVSSLDAAIFRRLLKSVAILQGGRWRIKS